MSARTGLPVHSVLVRSRNALGNATSTLSAIWATTRFVSPATEFCSWMASGLFRRLAIIAPGSMLTATLGARAAHALSRRRLSQAFGVFLLIVGTRMLYRALA